jgi:hypothetical protein
VIDLIHVPREEMAALRALLPNKAYLRALATVLMDVALSGDVRTTMSYDHGYGSSKYYEKPVQIPAFDGLVVAASHVDLSGSIPAVVARLQGDVRFKYRACWLLKTLANQKRANALLILDELKALGEANLNELLKDKDVKKLVETCQARISKK